jgi:hypothetical protein
MNPSYEDQRATNGPRSGQITSGEAARTNQNQAEVAQQVHNDHAANGGAGGRRARERRPKGRLRT